MGDKEGVIWENNRMKTTQPNTPTQADYRILSLIEQMMEVVPKGTALGLCDLIRAMLSGYFIESGGAVMPAVEAYFETRSRR
ncbi:MAG: hypothetical protein GY805_39135 [Chloroflexi bacterium]|nr:hypothetical protein [Chloroflexota bacterium]